MIDPLSCLREYTIKKQPIVEKNNYIILGEYCWPKSVKTNYQIFNKQKDAPKEYYTLECLLFLLNNLKLHHVAYVNFAKDNDVSFIRRPDRKKLLAYLMGEISTSPSIDTSAPVVYPTKLKLEKEKEITDEYKVSNIQQKLSSKLSSSQLNYFESARKRFQAFREKLARNEKQFPPLQKVTQVKEKEDYEKINEKPKIENSFALSSSEASISKNEDQKHLNHEHNSFTVKQEVEELDEIDIKPSTEEL